ncbi:MAG: tetratricopeptide repeat protein [Bradymonadales bacterium]|nr:tetratricopeptide repeat protein [Bradymonadales bacterium]
MYEDCRDAGAAGILEPVVFNQLNAQAAIDLQLAGEFRASLLFIERVVNNDPAYHEIYFLRGYAFQMLENNAEAIISYQRQLARNPNHRQSLFNLAYAQMTSGDYSAAIQTFSRTLEVDPDYTEVHLHLATCLDALGQRNMAEQHRRQYRP